jgi:hypothetical protein
VEELGVAQFSEAHARVGIATIRAQVMKALERRV